MRLTGNRFSLQRICVTHQLAAKDSYLFAVQDTHGCTPPSKHSQHFSGAADSFQSRLHKICELVPTQSTVSPFNMDLWAEISGPIPKLGGTDLGRKLF